MFGFQNTSMEVVASTGMAMGCALANRNGKNRYRRVCFYTQVAGGVPRELSGFGGGKDWTLLRSMLVMPK